MGPSTANPAELRLTGQGHLVSNVGSFGAEPRNFVAFRDLFTDAKGRICKRPGIGLAKGGLAAGAVKSMHEYVYTNPTTGAETRWLFRATAAGIEYYNRGANIWTAITWPPGFAPSGGGLWVFENVPIGLTAYCLAVNGKDETIVFDGTDWRIAGVDGPAAGMGYTLGGVYGLGGTFGFLTLVNCTKGSKTVTGFGGTQWLTFPEGPITAEMRIEIDGNTYEVASVTTNTSIELTEKFKEDTAIGLTYRIFYGFASWLSSPRYAIAYENPTTGHSSNIRAAAITTQNILELTEEDVVGRKPTLTAIPYGPAQHAQGYTKIRPYRAAQDATILQALDTTINNSAVAGTTTFSESPTTFVDTFLTGWQAQTTKFAKPPAGMISIKYHQGRVFGLTRTRLYYSLHEVDVVGQLGVAAFSWPATQWISVNQPRGLLLLGAEGGETTLVVQTANGDFAVIGYDQRTAPIGLVKLPTRGGESFQYGAIGTEGRLLSFYNDARLYDWPGLNDYGESIQNKIDTLRPSLLADVRVYRFTSRSFDLVFLSGAGTDASTENDVTYVFDVQRRKWYEWTVGFSSFTTAKNPTTSSVELWGSTSDGESFLLLQPGVWTDRGSSFTPYLKTSLLWPVGERDLADLKTVQAFTSDASLTWSGEMLIKGQADGAGQAFSLETPRHQDGTLAGKVDWTPSDSIRKKAAAVQVSLTFPTTAGDLIVDEVLFVFDKATMS